ncbi:MAG TPA: glycosyltransferase, partial [Planctomycetaceae bacterium]|nr:glycosyltransferase [Planctomycetaceae bacterium]
RNAASTLEDCLDSILAQTYAAWELIAVDDGSVDDSPILLQKTARSDSRIRVLSPGRIGLIAAINLGNESARADLIARMDSDDIMFPERLQKQFDYLCDRPDVELVASRVELFPEEQIQSGYREYIRWQNDCLTPKQIADHIYLESPLANPSVMFRKQLFERFGGYRDGPFPEDYEFSLRLHQSGVCMAKLPETLLRWRDSETRTTRTDPRYSRRAFDEIRAEYLARDTRLHTGRPLVVWGAGRSTRLRAANLKAHGIEFAAYIDIDPNKIGQQSLGISVHPPEWLDRPDKQFVLNYVANHGARQQIEAMLHNFGYEIGTDYLPVG